MENMTSLFANVIDLTHPLANGMPVYPGDPVPSFKRTSTIEEKGVNVSALQLGSHTGTHIDAPRHFIKDGTPVDKLPIQSLAGEALVLDLRFKQVGSGITPEDIEKSLAENTIQENDIVILYTGCSDRWGDPEVNRNFTFLTPEGASYLISHKVKAVGIDFLSIEQFHSKDHATHIELLSHDVLIIESLSKELKQVVGRRVFFAALPIKLQDGDGAPCRAFVIP